jgi:biopolymer transport protein ExbD
MAGGAQMDDDDEISGINVTPLVDIMLVLLIIFMVASNYIVKEAIEVNLPKAATGEEVNNDNKSIALIIKEDGRLFLNGELTTEEKIAEASKALSREPNAQALIAADRGTSHGAVIKLIDLIRANGLTSFAINIDPDNDPVVDEDAGSGGDALAEGEAPGNGGQVESDDNGAKP